MKKLTLLGVEGCPTCAQLDQVVQRAIAQYGGPVKVEKITDIDRLPTYQAGGLPAVIMEGKVLAVRRVPRVDELVRWLGGE